MLERRPDKLFLSILISLGIGMGAELRFNRKLTGVAFWPYITDGLVEAPETKSFTVENVRTMLEVVSTKFSRILTTTVDGMSQEPFKRNDSYYNKAGIIARTAEIAAHINREKGNLSLTIIIGILNVDNAKYYNQEFETALEASQKAQHIFRGTVRGIMIWDGYYNALTNVTRIKVLTTKVKTLRERTSGHGVPIGIQLDACYPYLGLSVLHNDSFEVWRHKKQLLVNSDFIVCFIKATNDHNLSENMGASGAFKSMQSRILAQRDGMKSLNSDIEVMWQTSWIGQFGNRLRYNVTKHIRDLRDYWLQADNFAKQNDYPVYLTSAIGELGWWKLKRQDLINNRTAYVEYVSALPDYHKNNTNKNTDLIETSTRNPVMVETVSLSTEDIQENSIVTDRYVETGETTATIMPSTSYTSMEPVSPVPIWIYVSALIGTVLITALLVGFVFFIHRKWSSSRLGILTRQEVDEFRHGISDNDYNDTVDENLVNNAAFKQPYNMSLEISRANLEIMADQVLGGGEFGRVLKALVRNNSDVAIEVALKMTKPNAGATAVKGFLSEIKILTFLGQHPNIVPIFGAFTAEINKGVVYIATELCPLGSLRNCLKNYQSEAKDPNGSSVPLNDMIRWSYEIACGMEYLGEKGVIHADLATRNVLLSSESTAKITDFGLSRRMYEYTNYTKTSQEPLPWRWMAYESLKMMDFSPKSDVWSYGVTLWEIFSLGAQPYPGLTWTLDFVETLEDGFRLKKPKHATSEIFKIMEKCWSLGADARPSFTELNGSMRDIQTKSIEDCYTSLSLLPADRNAKEMSNYVTSPVAI